ncbi:hypothetical protein Pmani_036091 [Petrolisthes manimaculis]|uniref:Uncharacterized protein n=1 Tax=Petrolisthes manimaculis TaxID=1843537 RepID=A0AAE1NKW5_9EUCA|nr:hypothetical protein Pmani_036091 [Petrolisthes manimaculis]
MKRSYILPAAPHHPLITLALREKSLPSTRHWSSEDYISRVHNEGSEVTKDLEEENEVGTREQTNMHVVIKLAHV